MTSPPQTPRSTNRRIIDIESSSPEPIVVSAPPIDLPSSSQPSTSQPLVRPRAAVRYASTEASQANSPAKPHPLHQSPVHPRFLAKDLPLLVKPDAGAAPRYGLMDGSMALSFGGPRKVDPQVKEKGKGKGKERLKQTTLVEGGKPEEKKTQPKTAPLPPPKRSSTLPLRPTQPIVYPLHRTSTETKLEPNSTSTSASTSTAVKKYQKRYSKKDQQPSKDENPLGLEVFSLKDKSLGPTPSVVLTKSKEEVDELIGCLKGPISFDMEWPISRRKNYEPKTALLQLSSPSMIILVQISSSALRYRIPPSILKIITNPDIIKLGVNIRGDALKLKRDFGILMRGFLDLSRMARAVDPIGTGPGKACIGLQKLTAHYLKRHLPKPSLRTGDWTADLSFDAITYAAADVHSALLIFHHLRRRLLADPNVPDGECVTEEKIAREARPTERERAWCGDLWEEEKEEKRKEKEKMERELRKEKDEQDSEARLKAERSRNALGLESDEE